MTKIVYLHGFLSSPLSEKAQLTLAYLKQHHPECELIIPTLPNQPVELLPLLEDLIAQHQLDNGEGVLAIGSSMGGYLASYLVERCGGKAVLVNPAVFPYRLLLNYLGDHVNPYTKVAFSLRESDMQIIQALDTPTIKQPQAYKVLLQTGDETLDYAEAVHKYAGGDVIVEQGGDHSFVDYAKHLPTISKFLLG